MLELNIKWLLVQLINFLALLILLNYILFKPLLCLLTRRDDHIKRSLNTAKAMDKEKDDLLGQMEAKLLEARNHAKKIFEELSREGMETQKQTLDSVKEETTKIAQKAQEDMEISVEKARGALKRDVEVFSKKIIEKMVGV